MFYSQSLKSLDTVTFNFSSNKNHDILQIDTINWLKLS